MIFVDILGEERVILPFKMKDNVLVEELWRIHVYRRVVGLTFANVKENSQGSMCFWNS